MTLTASQKQANWNEVSGFLTIVATSAMSITYYLMFKSYHASLEKLDQLNELLTNPKARVAHGDHGKTLLAKIESQKKPAAAATAVDPLAEQLAQIEELLNAKKVQAYEPPRVEAPRAVYSLDQMRVPLMSQAPQFQVQPPVMQAAALPSLSKQDLIKLLLSELSKPDLEK